MRRSNWGIGNRVGVVALMLVGCAGDPSGRAIEARPRGSTFQPCGAELDEVDDVWAHSNGDVTGTVSSCGNGGNPVGGVYQWQCVEFAQRYMNTIYQIDLIWPVDYAAQMCDSHPSGVSRIPAGGMPVHGDLAVWTGPGAGHVAVVDTVYDGGISIVEQNASAAGRRELVGDPVDGYHVQGSTRNVGCFMRADANPAPTQQTPPPQPPPAPTPPPSSGSARCDDLGYYGACVGDTSVWSENGTCRVRDCNAEGRACGLISNTAGEGCLGGTAGTTVFDCAEVGYEGRCLSDETLVWVESGACKTVHCPDLGRGCGWDEAVGYNCV